MAVPVPFHTRSLEAAFPGCCLVCSTLIDLGDPIWPDLLGQWRCWGCHSNSSQLERIGGWVARFRGMGRILSLSLRDVSILVEQFTRRGINSSRLGARSTWHTTSSSFARLEQPFDESTHGLLLDALEYNFRPGIPYPGTAVIVGICEDATLCHTVNALADALGNECRPRIPYPEVAVIGDVCEGAALWHIVNTLVRNWTMVGELHPARSLGKGPVDLVDEQPDAGAHARLWLR